MTAFDPIKALREELAGLAEVDVAERRREGILETRIAEAESELSHVRKVRGYLLIDIEQKRERLRQLEDAKAKAEATT